MSFDGNKPWPRRLMVKLQMTRGLTAQYQYPHLAERGVGHGLELVVRGGGDPRVGQPHRHHLVQGQRHGGGALGPAGSTHMLGRALQIYRDLAPDSQHPLPRIPDSCYQVQTERQQTAGQQFDNHPAQLPAPCTLSCLICVDIMQMLPPLTVSTQYLHSIYTISTQYLHNIYTLSTHSTQYNLDPHNDTHRNSPFSISSPLFTSHWQPAERSTVLSSHVI